MYVNWKQLPLKRFSSASFFGNVDTWANSDGLFRKLNWLLFFVDAKINTSALDYKCINEQCPDYIKDVLELNSGIHSRTSH